ncbi:MAG TPA: SURF1 family protein [Longimicrobiaceae bacterium]|nr:SURF1 family protein [Longimicrobiaceae bacterium]
MKPSPRGMAAALLAVLVASVCVRLGFWQLDRLEQRRERNAAIRAAGRLPTLLLDSASVRLVADSPAAYLDRRVRVRGVYDPSREVVLRGRAREGRPGVHLVTPLRIAGSDDEVLVNRGWVPSPDGATVDRAPYAEPGPQEVVGLLQEVPATGDRGQPAAPRGGGDTTFRRLDLATVRERSAGPVLPVYVQQLPDPARSRPPFRVPAPVLSEGSHLSYAVQWFSFAAIALLGLVVVALRGRKR